VAGKINECTKKGEITRDVYQQEEKGIDNAPYKKKQKKKRARAHCRKKRESRTGEYQKREVPVKGGTESSFTLGGLVAGQRPHNWREKRGKKH